MAFFPFDRSFTHIELGNTKKKEIRQGLLGFDDKRLQHKIWFGNLDEGKSGVSNAYSAICAGMVSVLGIRGFSHTIWIQEQEKAPHKIARVSRRMIKERFDDARWIACTGRGQRQRGVGQLVKASEKNMNKKYGQKFGFILVP
ncbi:unnamed protein product [Sphenostylis stenocarpa]|uniref:Uncharacterized protein n=1 Tax=Sphenostylis stenocarpa TaxID=92480 RepID=A0AA86VDY1_9FABA|nr:unnamed protein product [Sphenostylis stenocarpa]